MTARLLSSAEVALIGEPRTTARRRCGRVLATMDAGQRHCVLRLDHPGECVYVIVVEGPGGTKTLDWYAVG